MSLDHMLLAIACAASLPSAGLVLRTAHAGRSAIEMTLGATISIVSLALVVVQASTAWLAAALASAVCLLALAQHRDFRWPLLSCAIFALMVYLHRTQQIAA